MQLHFSQSASAQLGQQSACNQLAGIQLQHSPAYSGSSWAASPPPPRDSPAAAVPAAAAAAAAAAAVAPPPPCWRGLAVAAAVLPLPFVLAAAAGREAGRRATQGQHKGGGSSS